MYPFVFQRRAKLISCGLFISNIISYFIFELHLPDHFGPIMKQSKGRTWMRSNLLKCCDGVGQRMVKSRWCCFPHPPLCRVTRQCWQFAPLQLPVSILSQLTELMQQLWKPLRLTVSIRGKTLKVTGCKVAVILPLGSSALFRHQNSVLFL